jgi:hypothetical protein
VPSAVFDDADLRAHVAALGPGALDELEGVLRAPTSHRAAILTALVARPAYADLAALIAIADSDETARLRLLRAIRGLNE